MAIQIKHIALGVMAAISCGGGLLPVAVGCSRIFWNTDPQYMIVGRSMDLYRDDKPRLVYFPRGIEHNGAAVMDAAHWVSKYASLAVTSFDAGSSDGMNEKGLAAHILYLDTTEYEPADQRPVISNTIWGQYVLDNYATVAEALEGLRKVRVVSRSAGGREWPLHLAFEDASGDSAIIEYVKEKMVVHHGKEFTVMTNDPTFEEQLANLKQYKLFGGKLALPGDIDPMSRFVRAASFLKTLPKAEDSNEAVAYLGGLVRSIMVPYGAEDTATSTGAPAVDVWPTRWVTIADLTNKRFYFLCTHSPNVFWIELDKLTSTAPDMLAVTPTNPDLNGDVSEQLIKFTSEQKEYPPPH